MQASTDERPDATPLVDSLGPWARTDSDAGSENTVGVASETGTRSVHPAEDTSTEEADVPKPDSSEMTPLVTPTPSITGFRRETPTFGMSSS